MADDLVLGDDGAPAAQQHDQQIEGAAAELDAAAVGEQMPGTGDDAVSAEADFRLDAGGSPAARIGRRLNRVAVR
ncbi:MAG: hypothetical protein WDM81_06075 [Rhizomicrobium sp.]